MIRAIAFLALLSAFLALPACSSQVPAIPARAIAELTSDVRWLNAQHRDAVNDRLVKEQPVDPRVIRYLGPQSDRASVDGLCDSIDTWLARHSKATADAETKR